MSKNKIIFLVLGFLVVLFILFIVLTLNGNKQRANDPATSSDFTIWTLNDDKMKFETFLNDFKLQNKDYKDKKINIESFSNYEDYYNSLIGAFLLGKGPDLFVLNNNDGKLFDGQILGIEPTVINPDDFRKNYEIVFSNDLIEKNESGTEYLRGIPLGYEVLGLYYNFRDLRGKKIKTWSEINDTIREVSDGENPVIGIGNGKTVSGAQDIMTQFFVQDGVKGVSSLNGEDAINSIGRYLSFGDSKLDNKYDSSFSKLDLSGKNNVDMFSEGDLQMIIGYPRMIEQIAKKGFGKSFLRVDTFPSYDENKGSLLANYNYFVINKNTKDFDLSISLLKYFSSDAGQKKYLETFDYYLPSLLSLVQERLEKTVSPDFVVKYKDFYNSSFDLVSFDKGNRSIYDEELLKVLDNSSNVKDLFENFRKKILCITSKMLKQENLSVSCNGF